MNQNDYDQHTREPMPERSMKEEVPKNMADMELQTFPSIAAMGISEGAIVLGVAPMNMGLKVKMHGSLASGDQAYIGDITILHCGNAIRKIPDLKMFVGKRIHIESLPGAQWHKQIFHPEWLTDVTKVETLSLRFEIGDVVKAVMTEPSDRFKINEVCICRVQKIKSLQRSTESIDTLYRLNVLDREMNNLSNPGGSEVFIETVDSGLYLPDTSNPEPSRLNLDEVPNATRKILIELRVRTWDEIRELDIEQFAKLSGVTPEMVSDIIALKLSLQPTDDNSLEGRLQADHVKIKIPEKLQQIPISAFESIAPRKLLLKFKALGISRLGDLSTYSIVDFASAKGVGQKAVEQLRSFLGSLSDVVPQIEITSNSGMMIETLDEELHDVTITSISSLIPGTLINKFKMLGIETLGDFTKTPMHDFRVTRGVGKKVLSDMESFALLVQTQKQKVLDQEHEATFIPTIPYCDDNSCLTNPWVSFIDQYLRRLSKYKSRHASACVKYFGLYNSSQYDTLEIGLAYNLSGERIRQIINTVIEDLQCLANGDTPKLITASHSEDFKLWLGELRAKLEGIGIIDVDHLEVEIQSMTNFVIYTPIAPYLLLLRRVFSAETLSKASNHFLQNDLLIFDTSIDKSSLLSSIKTLYDYLKHQVIPVSRFDILVTLRKENRFLSEVVLDKMLSSLPTIQELRQGDETYYQLELSALSSAVDMAIRILDEYNETMHIDTICKEINRRLAVAGVSKTVRKTSITGPAPRDERIISKGKTGYYALTEWGENTDSITTLIRSTLLKANKPLSASELVSQIQLIRPLIKTSSIRTIISMDYLRLSNNTFILPEWESQYSTELATRSAVAPKHSRLLEVMHVFESSGRSLIPFKELSRTLGEDLKMPRTTISAVLNNTDYFLKETMNGITYVRLINTEHPDKGPRQSIVVLESAQEYFNHQGIQQMKLRSFVKLMSERHDIPEASVYKSIQEQKDHYKKHESDGVVYLSLNFTVQP